MKARLGLALAAMLLAGAPFVGGAPADADVMKPAAGFGGAWVLVDSADDVVVRVPKDGWGAAGGAERPGGTGGRGAGGGFDLPLEVMTDARRLIVTDDGTTLRVTYPSGRKRTFVTDGAKRYLDDGDGPADVVARRKGTTVSVSSEWVRGYRLRETWELRESPRLLVVTGKVRGRESQEYVRRYAPAPPGEPAPTPAASPRPGPAEVPIVAVRPPAVDRIAECSIRPPRSASPADLARLVRVTQEEAARKAVASLLPLKPSDVISSDVEAYEGCLVWPFTLRLPERKGVQDVFVDAGDGGIVWSEFVPMGPSASDDVRTP